MPSDIDGAVTVGIDFGTLSGRAVVVRIADGEILGESVHHYRHGVMDRNLAAGDGRELPRDFALQVPEDYLEVLRTAVPEAIAAAGIQPSSIVGIGIDATSANVIPTNSAGRPLCELDEFRNNPHAYAKLWKHHGAESHARRIVTIAKERGEPWLNRYGGQLSSELLLPKALELLESAPEVYAAAAHLVDSVDWITWQLTGRLTYAAGDSGYKRLYQDSTYPSPRFLAALNPSFVDVYAEKMAARVLPLGARVGGLNAEASGWTGIPEGVAVATGNIDAHVHAVSVGAVGPGQLTGILGTSNCWVLPAAQFANVPGIFGAVDGGIVAGLWGYEGGQSAVGDLFDWHTSNNLPDRYLASAAEQGIHINELLMSLTADRRVGEAGLLALDWLNGNRSILVDSSLSGLIIGQTLRTTPPEQFRALVESTAFGAKVIIDNFEAHGVPVQTVTVAGGLLNSPSIMQVYADVLNRPLSVSTVSQAGGHGSAIFAAVAAGRYVDVASASLAMRRVDENAYLPSPGRADAYNELYRLYTQLYFTFGRDNEVMHHLGEISRRASEAREPGSTP